MYCRVDDRDERFNASVKIARHQIGRRNIDVRAGMGERMTAAKGIDARMFKETTDN